MTTSDEAHLDGLDDDAWAADTDGKEGCSWLSHGVHAGKKIKKSCI